MDEMEPETLDKLPPSEPCFLPLRGRTPREVRAGVHCSICMKYAAFGEYYEVIPGGNRRCPECVKILQEEYPKFVRRAKDDWQKEQDDYRMRHEEQGRNQGLESARPEGQHPPNQPRN